jgi:hypothetical protein
VAADKRGDAVHRHSRGSPAIELLEFTQETLKWNPWRIGKRGAVQRREKMARLLEFFYGLCWTVWLPGR